MTWFEARCQLAIWRLRMKWRVQLWFRRLRVRLSIWSAEKWQQWTWAPSWAWRPACWLLWRKHINDDYGACVMCGKGRPSRDNAC